MSEPTLRPDRLVAAGEANDASGQRNGSTLPLNDERPYVSWYGGKRSQTWRTPPQFFQSLNQRYGFTMDGAASKGNGLLAKVSTAEEPLSWEGERVFCNPPWSNIRPFVELAAKADLAVLLVPARTNAEWFHRALKLGAVPRYFLGRLTFVGANGQCPVDCCLLVFGDESQEVAA